LILRCLAKSPAERPADFHFLENELSELLWSIGQEKVPAVMAEELTHDDLINRSISLSALGYHDEALACLEDLTENRPKSARAWRHMGDVLCVLTHYDEALACFDRALGLEPSAPAWSSKAKALAKLRRYDEALLCLDLALALGPRLAFVWKDKGRTLINLGQFEESLTCLNRALAINPQHVEAHNSRGLAYSGLGKDDKAIEAYKRAINVNPEYAEAHYNLGNAYSHLGCMTEALESYTQAISSKPNYTEALECFARECRKFYHTSKQFVSDSYAESLITFLSGGQTDPEAVVSSAIEFLQLSGFDPKVLYLLGNKIYQSLEGIHGKRKQALVDTLMSVRQNIYTLEEDRSVFYWLAKIYYSLDLYNECLEVFQAAIRLFGPDDKALYYIAACYEMRGDKELALDGYKRALALDPDCLLTIAGIKRMQAEVR
jgi:tetratricopeptide (TPR) repeat protein